jgi:hypothetical protein
MTTPTTDTSKQARTDTAKKKAASARKP